MNSPKSIRGNFFVKEILKCDDSLKREDLHILKVRISIARRAYGMKSNVANSLHPIRDVVDGWELHRQECAKMINIVREVAVRCLRFIVALTILMKQIIGNEFRMSFNSLPVEGVFASALSGPR